MNEAINLARIRYQCRRGMLELDVLLESFLATAFVQLPSEEQQSFVELLAASDQQLYDWLVKKQQALEPKTQLLINKILAHHKQD